MTAKMDISITRALPEGAKFKSAESHGKSDWTSTTCVTAVLLDGTEKKFFLKCAAGEVGRTMLEGEFTASTMIYKAVPELIPQPYSWGRMEESLEEEWFFLSEYKDMDLTFPDPSKFVARLVALHSSGTSENEMYGFPVTTCDGAVPHDVTWQKDWGTFFAQLLRGVASFDANSNGHWTELDDVVERTTSQVIPRLLGQLKIRPRLIHGDMHEGNIGTDRGSGRIMIFDASSYYAHNEMELGLWQWNSTMSQYMEIYRQLFKPSEPIEEWDDRNKLYSVKTKLNYSGDHSDSDSREMRRVAYRDLCDLCEKYGSSEISNQLRTG